MKCEHLKELFEGRAAIYIEQGVLLVRVSDIDCRPELRQVHANVEEIPTPGLERNLICSRNSSKPRPLRWHIVSGFLTTVSMSNWKVGYGGWQLYFSKKLISGFKDLAAAFSLEDHHPVELYNRTIKYLMANGGYAERPIRFFPASDRDGGDLIKSS